MRKKIACTIWMVWGNTYQAHKRDCPIKFLQIVCTPCKQNAVPSLLLVCSSLYTLQNLVGKHKMQNVLRTEVILDTIISVRYDSKDFVEVVPYEMKAPILSNFPMLVQLYPCGMHRMLWHKVGVTKASHWNWWGLRHLVVVLQGVKLVIHRPGANMSWANSSSRVSQPSSQEHFFP